MRAWLERILDGEDLVLSEAEELFDVLVEPRTPPVVVGALLAALRAKGERGEEIRGLVRAMRARALACDLGPRDHLVDIVGTGGDGASSFNLSTGAALLAAAAGARVAKHGGGAVSSRSGSADVLLALGVPLPLSGPDARRLFERTGFTFLHAPHFHRALHALAPLRGALGTRTVFNLIGPLCNPAAPPFAVIGAATRRAARALAEAVCALPGERTFVIHGSEGWDEPTPAGPFELLEATPDGVVETVRDPLQVGIPRCRPDDLRGGDPATNARALREVFGGVPGPHRDALVLGAALALEVSGRSVDMAEGADRARAALDDGRAGRLLHEVVAFGAETRRGLHV